jgi:hypothetical protein
MDNAAKAMQYYIWYAFQHGGPGWKPLSNVTIEKKMKSGAPDPRAILKEFRVMMRSIQVKDETTTTIPKWGMATFWNNAVYKITEYKRSVGLFSDTALKYDPKKEIGFRQDPLDVVSRGFKHEFGGFEYQVIKSTGQMWPRYAPVALRRKP